MIGYAKTVPTLWSIAREEGVVVGNIAWPMLEECIKSGEAKYKGADGPHDFAPDYAAMKAAVEAEGHGDERRFFIGAFQSQYKVLSQMFKEGQYMDMVVLTAGEMARLAVTESPEERELYEQHKREVEELAEAWKAQMAGETTSGEQEPEE